MKLKKEKTFGYSLPFIKFRQSIETEIRSYWQFQCTTIYAERWINSNLNQVNRITMFPGDNQYPFINVDIPPSDFLSEYPNQITLACENTLINIITIFEVYLNDILQRIFYINPNLLLGKKKKQPDDYDESQLGFLITELIEPIVAKQDIREWLAERVTYKYIRNKQHSEIILKLSRFIKFDIKSKEAEIEEWNKWTYVRNAIIHNGREVTKELSKIWNSRFSTKGNLLNLQNNEIAHLYSLSIELAKFIDNRATQTIIKDEDAKLLIREIFIRNGNNNSKQLSNIIFNILNIKTTTQVIEKTLSYQKKTNSQIQGWDFTEHFFKSIKLT